MSNALFGWQNNVSGAVLTTPNGTPGLYADNLKNDQGSPSMGWQFAGGSGVLIVDTQSAASQWRAFCMARTNLTAAATVRYRVGTLRGCLGPVVVPTDTNAGASAYNTTRIGDDGLAPDGSRGTYYRAGSGGSVVSVNNAYVPQAGEPLTVSVWLRRTNGNSTSGYALNVNAGGLTYGTVYMTDVPLDSQWRRYSVTFTATAADPINVNFFADTGSGEASIAGGSISGPTYYDSGSLGAGVRAGFAQSVHVAPSAITGAACRFQVSDPSNPDGFINIPLLYAGPAWQPATNIAYDSTIGRDDQTDEITSRGGAEFPSVQWTRRRWDVSMQGIRSSELWAQAMELDRFARTGRNVLFVPNPASVDVGCETVYGRAKPLSDISFPFGNADRRAWRVRITERL